jgi:hypothetical protein
MSLYHPKSASVVQHDDGYWVHDKFGPLDGPYTRRDAYAVADAINIPVSTHERTKP